MKLVSRILWSAVYGATLVSMAFGGGVALAADIYVDVATGNDANSGTQASPVMTIGQGITLAAAGDTVHVLPGDYNQAVESFPLEMKPGVTVLAEYGTTSTYISTDSSDTLVVFEGDNFDASSMLQGFTLRGTTSTAQYDAVGVQIGYSMSDAAVTEISPIVRDNVMSGLDSGVRMYAGNDAAALVMSPVIQNNVIEAFDEYGVYGYASESDLLQPVITENLIVAQTSADESFTYGVYLSADGADSDDPTGATITADIESNIILRAEYGLYLYADQSDGAPPAPNRELGSGAEPTIASDVVGASNVLASGFGGTLNAYIANNRVGSRDQQYGYAVWGTVDNGSDGDEDGGTMDLTVKNNTLLTHYGVYLSTFGENYDGIGGYLHAEVRDNVIDATYYDDSFALGVHAGAYGEGGTITVEVVNNDIGSQYGVHLFADGPNSDYGPGGIVNATVEDNVLDGFRFYNYSYGVYGFAEGATGYETPGHNQTPGIINVDITGNDVAAYQGVYMWAESEFAFNNDAFDIGGRISGTIDSNQINSVNEFQQGYGVYLFAESADPYDQYSVVEGASFDFTVTNNIIRGYYGVYAFADGYGEFGLGGSNSTLNLINNTLIGGGVGFDYEEGAAAYMSGGGPEGSFNPVVDNNILLNTSACENAPFYSGNANPYSDPTSLDNNDLFTRYVGGPLATIRGTDFFSIGVINSFAFASNNVSVEPTFACETEGNYRLDPTSALLDIGKLSTAPADDFEGDARPIGGGVDIGADEFNGTKVGNTFQDVGPDSPFYPYVEALAASGITGGCSAAPPLYCPAQAVSREQMAIFIIRALGVPPDSSGAPAFLDVPSSRFSYAYIQAFAALGITGGCGGGNFCPLDPVTRRQMAVFLIRALGESPDGSLPALFADVPPADPYYGYIQKLAKLGITGGCGPSVYCPDAIVSREQMAAFIARAFDLQLPLPCVQKIAERHGVQPGVLPEGQVGSVSSGTPVVEQLIADTVLLSQSGVGHNGPGAQLGKPVDAPKSARGAKSGIGPAANRYLKLTVAQRDAMLIKKASATPNRDAVSGRAATSSLSRKQFRQEVDARVKTFTDDWTARGKDAKQLSQRRVKALAQRQLRFPAAAGPADVDQWVMHASARRAAKGRVKVGAQARQAQRAAMRAQARKDGTSSLPAAPAAIGAGRSRGPAAR